MSRMITPLALVLQDQAAGYKLGSKPSSLIAVHTFCTVSGLASLPCFPLSTLEMVLGESLVYSATSSGW